MGSAQKRIALNSRRHSLPSGRQINWVQLGPTASRPAAVRRGRLFLLILTGGYLLPRVPEIPNAFCSVFVSTVIGLITIIFQTF